MAGCGIKEMSYLLLPAVYLYPPELAERGTGKPNRLLEALKKLFFANHKILAGRHDGSSVGRQICASVFDVPHNSFVNLPP